MAAFRPIKDAFGEFGMSRLVIHCGQFVGRDEPSILCDGRVLHERCHDAYARG